VVDLSVGKSTTTMYTSISHSRLEREGGTLKQNIVVVVYKMLSQDFTYTRN
jgi:hypothetical protein